MKDTGDIRGLAEVSEAYGRAGFSELPPEELDRAIRSAAARATRRPLLAAHLPTWALPIAIAATLIIGVTVLLRSNDTSIGTSETAQTPLEDRGATPAREPSSDATPVQPMGQSNPSRMSTKPAPDTGQTADGCGETVVIDPDAWLACISSLRKQGSLEQAARELESLRTRFPQFALPAELDEPSR